MNLVVLDIVTDGVQILSECGNQLVISKFSLVLERFFEPCGILVLAHYHNVDLVAPVLSCNQDDSPEQRVPQADGEYRGESFLQEKAPGEAMEQDIHGQRKYAEGKQALDEDPEDLRLPVVPPFVQPHGEHDHGDDKSHHKEIQRARPGKHDIYRIRKYEHLQKPLEDADMDGKVYQHDRHAEVKELLDIKRFEIHKSFVSLEKPFLLLHRTVRVYTYLSALTGLFRKS